MGKYDDLEALLQQSEDSVRMNAVRDADAKIHRAHRAAADAHDHLTAASEMRQERGLSQEDFVMVALRDVTTQLEAMESLRQELAIHAVRDLNLAAVSVASQIGVAPTTVSRWVHKS